MPSCQGPGNGPCQSKDSNISSGQGELWLCKSCRNKRFPPKRNSDTNVKATDKATNSDHDCNTCINNALLGYTLYVMQSASREMIRKTILGHFTAVQIAEAKDLLWEKCPDLGEKKKRRDSPGRTEKEANVDDILDAYQKLDKDNKTPCVVINAVELGSIPKFHPEEVSIFSIVDRLKKLEENVDRLVCENIILKEKHQSTYAEVVKSPPPSAPSGTLLKTTVAPQANQTTIPKSVIPPSDVQPDVSVTRSQPDQAPRPLDSMQPNSTVRSLGSQAHTRDQPPVRGGLPQRGLGRGRGRGTNRFSTLGAMHNLTKSNQSLDRLSHISQHDTSYDSSEFFTPRSTTRKQARQEKRRQKVITGKNRAPVQFGSFKGAPEPSRDLFVYRVDKAVEQTDILQYLQSQSIDVRDLRCISHEDARYKSFKLTTKMSDIDNLFTDSFWPSGVKVRRFIPPKAGTTDTVTT